MDFRQSDYDPAGEVLYEDGLQPFYFSPYVPDPDGYVPLQPAGSYPFQLDHSDIDPQTCPEAAIPQPTREIAASQQETYEEIAAALDEIKRGNSSIQTKLDRLEARLSAFENWYDL